MCGRWYIARTLQRSLPPYFVCPGGPAGLWLNFPFFPHSQRTNALLLLGRVTTHTHTTRKGEGRRGEKCCFQLPRQKCMGLQGKKMSGRLRHTLSNLIFSWLYEAFPEMWANFAPLPSLFGGTCPGGQCFNAPFPSCRRTT